MDSWSVWCSQSLPSSAVANTNHSPKIVLLTGVSGSGKSTIGKLLSAKLQWPFYDGDDFHPPSNIKKMATGIPLTDEDRWPWLKNLKQKIAEEVAANQNAIFACSALRQIYRDFLTSDLPQVKIIYLSGTPETLTERLRKRRNHFMRTEMLASQLVTLEEPNDALTIDIAQSPESIVTEICRELIEPST